jgi:peptidoglycan/LPS O-acetylase OafA/YrhL
MASARLFNLDCIRVIANLLIILFHYNVWTERLLGEDLLLVRDYPVLGAIGVSLFLILSGASLSLSTREQFRTLDFYRKRWLTIFPMFYLVYACCMVLALLSGQYQFSPDRNPFAFVLTIFALDGLSASLVPTYYLIGEWFLGCIVIIYLLFPLIHRCFSRSQLLTLLFSFAIVILLQAYYTLPLPLQYLPLFRLAEFVCGMYILSQFSANQPSGRIRVCALALLLVSLLFVDSPTVSVVRMNVCGILAFICLFLAMARPRSERIVKSVAILSRLSYPAFLVHHIILKQVIIFTHDMIESRLANLFVFVLVLIVVYLTASLFDTILSWLIQFARHQGSPSLLR